MTVSFLLYLSACLLDDFKTISLHNSLCNALMSITNYFRNGYPVFKPTCLLVESVLFHMLRIIRMVIYQSHCTKTVITIYEHSFRVEVGKSERTDNLSHSSLASEFDDCIKQCSRNLKIIDEVDPSETDLLNLPCFISLMIYDGCNSTYYFSIFVGEIEFSFAELKCGILFLAECCEIIHRH